MASTSLLQSFALTLTVVPPRLLPSLLLWVYVPDRALHVICFIMNFFSCVFDRYSSLSVGVPDLSFILYYTKSLSLGHCPFTHTHPRSSSSFPGAESCHIQEFMLISVCCFSSPCRWSVLGAKEAWQVPTEPSLYLVRCVPKWVRSAQTACCCLIVSGRSSLLVGDHCEFEGILTPFSCTNTLKECLIIAKPRSECILKWQFF